MSDVYRYKVHLNYSGGGPPGLSVIHSTEQSAGDTEAWATAFANLLRSAWMTCTGYIISSVSMTVDPEVLVIDIPTGKMLKPPVVITPPAPATGGDVDTSMPRYVQANCRHITDAVTNRGHRVNGRTFVGPLGGSAIGPTGQLTTAAITAFTSMWDGMQDIAAARLVVYHRPAQGYTKPSGEVVPDTQGMIGHVQQTVVPPNPAVLRSRRD